jgi:hypothetical protein
MQRAHLPASGEDPGGVDRSAGAEPVRAKGQKLTTENTEKKREHRGHHP